VKNFQLDITSLVMDDPKSEMSPLCQGEDPAVISTEAGNMFIMGEPGKHANGEPGAGTHWGYT